MKKVVLILAAIATFLTISCGGGVKISPEMQGLWMKSMQPIQ